MPRPHSPEFRQRAVQFVRLREKPIVAILRDLGILDGCPRNWMAQADIDKDVRAELICDERAELVTLRHKGRMLEFEAEILKRTSAYLAQKNVLPK